MPASCRFAMGVHTLLLLAHSEGQSLTSSAISGSTNTNPVVVRRLLCALHRAGLVQSQKGPHGGARLAHSPGQITLGDVYRAVETAEPLNRPRARPNPKCPVGAQMEAVLNGIFASAQTALERELKCGHHPSIGPAITHHTRSPCPQAQVWYQPAQARQLT